MYFELIKYLQKGLPGLKRLNRNQKCSFVWKAQRYSLLLTINISMLRYREHNNALCIHFEDEKISQFLNAVHEDHMHYTGQFRLNFFVSQVYWPTWVKNIYSWYKSYHPYQLKAYKPSKMKMQIIQTLKPMVMVGLDWVGSITSLCIITSVVYILLMVYYIS